MGSPFGPILANLFLCHHATKWLKNFPEGFKPIFYKRYVYDIFVLFEKPEQVLPFNHLIKKHKNINFPFLFSKLSVYRKDTFSLSHDIQNSADSQHQNINLPKYSHFYMGVSLQFLIFLNFISRLKHSKKRKRKYTKFLEKSILKFLDNTFVDTFVITVLKLKIRIVLKKPFFIIMKVRVSEHQGVFPRTSKLVKRLYSETTW